MDWIHSVLLILIGSGAGFIQRVSGFGLSIFTMIFLPHFLPTHTAAAAISALLSSATTTYNAIRYRKNVAYKMVLPMIITALVLIPPAVHFSVVVPGKIFKILLGIILILISLYFIFFNTRIRIRPTLFNGILSGSLSGILGGLFSTSGPPAVIYLSSAITENTAYFATIQFYFCITNLYTTAMRIINGIITPDIWLYSAIGMIGCMIGDFIGKKVFDKLDSDKLKKIIYIGMIISGIVMFF
ncbi:MAG: sulfite exporter TauE/SafE family protein [Clostridia bacterium]|nr:sulfite exporter TauE/SafE family protein [Clostridia bacterium]